MSNTGYAKQGQPANEFIGAGAIYVNYGLSGEDCLGATKGGNSFNDNAEYREREADADYAPVMGARDLVKLMPQLTVPALNINVQQALKYFAGMQADTKTSGSQKLYRTWDLADSYFTNIAWVGRDRAGNNTALVLANPIGDGVIDLASAKDEEVVLSVQFTAHIDPATFDPDTITTYPYHWEFEVSALTITVNDDAVAAIVGATVTLDDGQTGTTDASGEVAFEVTFGKVAATVVKATYVTQTSVITVDSDPDTAVISMVDTP